VLKLDFPAGQAGDQTGVIFSLADRDGMLFAPSEACRWSWASLAETEAQARDRVVDRQVATLYAARARAAAAEHNRAGHYELARHVLTATALRIRSYAGSDPELNALADSLLGEVETFSEGPLAPMVMKGAYFSAYVAERGRDVVGRARRSPGTA
jgi:hypothetical protein